jgi:AAA15 family ATPase/GTPase
MPQHGLAANDPEGSVDARVIEFLTAAGTGVIDYRNNDVDVPQPVRAIQERFGRTVGRSSKLTHEFQPSGDKISQLELAHQGAGGEAVYFELTQESEGTRRLLGLLVPVFRALDTGAVMVVDELDASLHTYACESLVALFSSPATNPKGAQLIATTHDTNILCSAHLRRDQVWLTEKDSEGASHLYPLTDFRTRKNDNLARGYLQGRYGAIPFSGRPSDVLATL